MNLSPGEISKMESLEDVIQGIVTYYQSLTVWRFTIIQELATFEVLSMNENDDDQLAQNIARLDQAFQCSNQNLDRIGELVATALELLY